MPFDRERVLYQWIGATRRDWRGQGHFRALTEESEAWAVTRGFNQVVVKTKNHYYGMRSTLAQLQFDVIKYERNPQSNSESKVYFSKRLSAEMGGNVVGAANDFSLFHRHVRIPGALIAQH